MFPPAVEDFWEKEWVNIGWGVFGGCIVCLAIDWYGGGKFGSDKMGSLAWQKGVERIAGEERWNVAAVGKCIQSSSVSYSHSTGNRQAFSTLKPHCSIGGIGFGGSLNSREHSRGTHTDRYMPLHSKNVMVQVCTHLFMSGGLHSHCARDHQCWQCLRLEERSTALLLQEGN